MTLKGSIAVITGAGRGLGAALAHGLADAGVSVALCARRQDGLDQVAASLAAKGHKALVEAFDITQRQAAIDFAARVKGELGAPDILINNAGLGWYKPLLEHSLDELDAVLDVNLKATVLMTRLLLPDMVEAGRGKILNIASDLSKKPLANMAPYVAAKHGVLGFASSLAREVKDKGVRVMTLMPGIMDTWFSGPPGDRDERWAMNPEHVAALALNMLDQPAYLLTDEVVVHPMHQDF